MTGAAIAIDNVTGRDTVLSVKQRVFAANRKLYVRRQRLVYTAGRYGMDSLPDDQSLFGVGVARDGSAQLDVLLADLTEDDAEELGWEVWHFETLRHRRVYFHAIYFSNTCARTFVHFTCILLEFTHTRLTPPYTLSWHL